MDSQKLKAKNVLQTVRENSNLWCLEKSSEMDADEEFEGEPITTKEFPIVTSAGDDPRSAILLKSLALKCECQSCNDYKYASIDQNTETESWSSPEIENTEKWSNRKSVRHRKLIDLSSEDLNFSDDNVVNYSRVKTSRKDDRMTNLASRGCFTKSSMSVNHTKVKTYETTSSSFFNVFFDIVFWPFVFFRAKR
ncbi:uncharacterized protein LOC105426870 [Pogonomyrmex barbatus]|uniref:Uncharacterized protein LOC105426870 n=1 Tax=Pogonomyrmex barbatus TaxID=144034 RepID=A0A6I9W3X7_9HYME|nr:uncharacterized protein LOC105426870 [Pogonomyrmex barbatus]